MTDQLAIKKPAIAARIGPKKGINLTIKFELIPAPIKIKTVNTTNFLFL